MSLSFIINSCKTMWNDIHLNTLHFSKENCKQIKLLKYVSKWRDYDYFSKMCENNQTVLFSVFLKNIL